MLKETLLEDLKEAMKQKDEVRKNTVQLVRANILQVEKDKGITVSEEQIINIIAKESKKRKDSLQDFEKSGRQDLITQVQREIEILATYLPKPLSKEEITQKVKDSIAKVGATSMKDMGIVMKECKEQMGASADGKIINEIVKELLG